MAGKGIMTTTTAALIAQALALTTVILSNTSCWLERKDHYLIAMILRAFSYVACASVLLLSGYTFLFLR